ncbi:hypothetical protein Sru01_34470 [Sphaerisporangium rufum]|uniref:Uncharacterized protein n=1 Tax=Sphaerisporangium rufum TaxID=1381558 RepID=A0A919V5M9_9ACTN|nr:hypothetical protein [Sphaerisporangium rufum]GII78465.1 hypothetical protein Sru01_34470 [Sphaerisporangium rufum]
MPRTSRPAAGSPPPPRWAVLAAHAVPLCVLPSSLWRLGVLLAGPDGWYHTQQQDLEAVLYMVALSVVSEGFALLTLGLVRPWGEVVPGWVPLLGGRRIPTAAAVVPAALGATAIYGLYAWMPLNAYVFQVRFEPTFGPADGPPFPESGPEFWLAVVCYLPLLAWAPLLTAVTVAYYRRRTGRVARSGRRTAGLSTYGT